MTEQIKFVVKELNAALDRNYDLIKFDALDEKQLVQVLVDLLVKFGAGEKMDVKEDDPEGVSMRLLEMLGSVKYRPPAGTEPPQFRSRLLAGEARTIQHALHWLLTNKENVKNTAYLAKYLKLPNIPNDVARNNTVQDLLDLYQNLIDEFKEVHKRTRLLQKENPNEIINDMKEMAVERDIVIKRLENVQANLIDSNEKDELLNISKGLRLQQEKSKELSHQYETQQQQLKTTTEQLKRYLTAIHGQNASPKSVNEVIKHLQDEVQLNSYLMKEKMPQEIASLQKELSIMQTISAEEHPIRSDLVVLQDKVSYINVSTECKESSEEMKMTTAHVLPNIQVYIDFRHEGIFQDIAGVVQIAIVNSEIEQLVARRLAATGPQEDKLAPFRQQAAVIRRNKDSSAARAQEMTATLREQEATLADLQSQVRQLLGDTVLRGEELKKYINTLRTKSTIYKRQRAIYSNYKIEAGILTRTLHIICNTDPTVEVALLNHKKLKIDEIENKNGDKNNLTDLAKKSLHDLSQMVAQTAQKLSDVRHDVQPLVEKIRPIKQEYQGVQQQYEQKKRVYEATSINITSQMEPLKNQVQQLADQINIKEDEWKNLRQKITKAENLQEAVSSEMKNAMQSPKKPSKMEILKNKLADVTVKVKSLEEDQRAISYRQSEVEEQTRLWENTLQLLRCKLRSRNECTGRQASVHITQHSQMMTLN